MTPRRLSKSAATRFSISRTFLPIRNAVGPPVSTSTTASISRWSWTDPAYSILRWVMTSPRRARWSAPPFRWPSGSGRTHRGARSRRRSPLAEQHVDGLVEGPTGEGGVVALALVTREARHQPVEDDAVE